MFRVPNTFVIISVVLLVMVGLTWVIPGGAFDTETVDGRERVIPGTFHELEAQPQGLGDLLMAPARGFQQAALIIAFVLIVGGAFAVFQETGALDAVIHRLAAAHDRSRLVQLFTIPLFMLLFSAGGAIFGMSESAIPFVLIFVPLALAMGYDSIVGICMPFLGAGIGFAGAYLNPFTVGIAQGIAGLPLFSGFGYRFVVWLILTTVGILWVMRYANRIRRDPTRSPVHELDREKRAQLHLGEETQTTSLSARQKAVLGAFGLAMAVLIYGVTAQGWYIVEITALFLAMGVAVGAIAGMHPDRLVKAFVDGAKTLVGTALIIAWARAILVIAKDGQIVGTMLNAMAGAIDGLHPVVSAQAMMLVQTLINFFMPSGSGQAALTMPIMAPLADLVGVSRQTAVLAFQFGDGFTNMIIPTSAVTMGVLTLSGIPWETWARWVLPFILLMFVLGMLLLVPPFFIGW